MSKTEIIYSDSWAPVSATKASKPFAALLDTRDSAWSDGTWVRQQAAALIKEGCRYFVCFGPESEPVHDWIDDEIFDRDDLEEIYTTFHDDEPIEDVANFFQMIALQGMRSGVVLTLAENDWKTLLQASRATD